MDERPVRRADEVVPAVVDVVPKGRNRLTDLAVDGQVHEVLELLAAESRLDEPQLHCGLLDALAEVLLVEGEPQLAVLENVVLPRVVVAAFLGLVSGHLSIGAACAPARRRLASQSYDQLLSRGESLTGWLQARCQPNLNFGPRVPLLEARGSG